MRLLAPAAMLALAVAVAAPAAAQDLQEKIGICIDGVGKVANDIVAAACTDLIDAAQAENETIGYFYAMRALTNDDRELNCSDGMKARELVANPDLSEPIDRIIANNC